MTVCWANVCVNVRGGVNTTVPVIVELLVTVPLKLSVPYQNPPLPVGLAPSCAVNVTCEFANEPLVTMNSLPVQAGTKLTVMTPLAIESW